MLRITAKNPTTPTSPTGTNHDEVWTMMGTSKTRWARRVARWTRRQQVVAVSMTIAVAGALEVIS